MGEGRSFLSLGKNNWEQTYVTRDLIERSPVFILAKVSKQTL